MPLIKGVWAEKELNFAGQGVPKGREVVTLDSEAPLADSGEAAHDGEGDEHGMHQMPSGEMQRACDEGKPGVQACHLQHAQHAGNEGHEDEPALPLYVINVVSDLLHSRKEVLLLVVAADVLIIPFNVRPPLNNMPRLFGTMQRR